MIATSGGRVFACLLLFWGMVSSANGEYELQWASAIASPYSDDGRKVAVTPDGDLIIVGQLGGITSGSDIGVVKLNNQGVQLWSRRYDGPAGSNDSPVAMLLDDNGDIYITGTTYNPETHYNYLTLKLDGSTGALLWEAVYDGPFSTDDFSYALATDSHGFVYVTGYSTRASSDATSTLTFQDYHTIKYNPLDGSEVWSRRYRGPEAYETNNQARYVVISAFDEIYVSGYSYRYKNKTDIVTLKYDVSGNLLNTMRYDSPEHKNDIPHALSVDQAGNVYVTGEADTAARGLDVVTLKYDNNGNLAWERLFNGSRDWYDVGVHITSDASGNVFVSGSSNRGTTSRGDFMVLKYDSKGNLRWAYERDGGALGLDFARMSKPDEFGNVFAIGYINTLSQSTDGLVLQLNADGHELWSRVYDGGAQRERPYDHFSAMESDAEGNLYVVGTSWVGDYQNNYDMLLVRYSRSNRPPTASLSFAGLDPVEGLEVRFDIDLSDPDSSAWSGVIDFGDGSSQSLVNLIDGTSVNHAYGDNSDYTATLTVTDDGGASTATSLVVSVANAAPVVNSLVPSTSQALIGSTVGATVVFSDAGSLDSHRVTLDWGDGTAPSVITSSVPGGATLSLSHAYTATGYYTLSLSIVDKDGATTQASFAPLVIYDVAAGSLSGAATFNWPSTNGPPRKARIVANISYLGQSTTPSGTFDVSILGQGFSFSSTSIDWLLVSGRNARARAIGTLDGVPDYTAFVSVDDDSAGDRVRVRITDPSGSIVHDTLPGASDDATPLLPVSGNFRIR